MKIGNLNIDDRDLIVAGAALGLIALFGHTNAKEIANKVGLAKQPLSMLPDFEEMKTITPDEWEVMDEEDTHD